MRLKELREEKGLLQREIAHALKTSQINISRWEREEVLPSSDFVIKLADFFEVTTDYLLGRSDDLGNVTVQGSPLTLPADEEQLLQAYRRLGGEYKKLAINTLNTWAGMPAQKATTKRA